MSASVASRATPWYLTMSAWIGVRSRRAPFIAATPPMSKLFVAIITIGAIGLRSNTNGGRPMGSPRTNTLRSALD